MSLYIFDINITTNICVFKFYYLSAWDCCWSLVSIWRFVCIFLNVCPFDCTAITGSAKVGPLNIRLTTPVGWLMSLQLIVLSRPVIERIRSVFVSFHLCIVRRLGVFVIRLRQISSLFMPPLKKAGILHCACRSVCRSVGPPVGRSVCRSPLPCATDNSRTLCPSSFKLGR